MEWLKNVDFTKKKYTSFDNHYFLIKHVQNNRSYFTFNVGVFFGRGLLKNLPHH